LLLGLELAAVTPACCFVDMAEVEMLTLLAPQTARLNYPLDAKAQYADTTLPDSRI
jgi:hypothetical protein